MVLSWLSQKINIKSYLRRGEGMIKQCISHKPKCGARIKRRHKPSLCCKYGWCEYAQPVPELEPLVIEKKPFSVGSPCDS